VKEVERLVRILNANKELLADPSDAPTASEPEEEL
jgi:hypothetical protein